jgi:hypothetical protein
MSIILYSHDVVYPNQAQIVHVQATHASGWLYHDRDKTHYALFTSLQDFVDQVKPIKTWEYNSEYPCFEEDVIEWWLATGGDVP